ncbi:sulfatase [Pontiella agarivorans]|uniref:Sulfatase n=1 Tax=Pontiella agarivorans TaxID=3038953 RepID=A0ABU5N0R3_9BACT|nr:sulfatase [Pontiella agarivorans]MDZ8120035.1 sulfatase [Pontiella agarivorans]
MRNRLFHSIVLLALAVGIHDASATDQPNVLFFLVDDLGYSDIGCYGNTLHETPNVDRLAREGIRFTDAYAACAVCSPTRASIQTGQYPVRFGITDWIPGARMPNTPVKEVFTERMLPVEAVTVADAFKGHGYRTAFVGKWHLNDKGQKTGFPEEQGYEVNIGGYHKGSPPGGYFAPFKNPKISAKPNDHYLTDRLGDECIELLGQYSKDRNIPFFLMLSFYTVHTPIQPKKELVRYYEKKLAKHPSDPWKNPKYAAMVHSMDENVGRVLEALKSLGLDEDTIVVFFSDNGGVEELTSCYPLSGGKGLYHEGGIRVPLIIRKPGMVEAGAESAAIVSSNDLFPTLLDMAGLPLQPAAHKDGRSLKPIFENKPFEGHAALYWHFPHYHGSGETPCSATRVGDYKFIRHYEDGKRELYNLKDDIGETNNLVNTMPEKAAELEAVLEQWLVEMHAVIPGPDPTYDPSKPFRKVKRK